MSSLLERMRQNPVANWTIADVTIVCRQHDIHCAAARGGGSHYKVAHREIAEKLTIPYKRPIKPIYIRKRFRRESQDVTVTAYDYPLIVEPIAPEDGGGFIALVPDLPGCMSDGETPAEAMVNVQDAIAAWIEAARDLGHAIPAASRHIALAS